MAVNYAVAAPHDKNSDVMPMFPSPKRATSVTSLENAAVSSLIGLHENTTVIEITSINTPVAFRWIPVTETAAVAPAGSVITTVAGSNFDHAIATTHTRSFVVPIETMPTASVVALGFKAGPNLANGLYRRIAVKSTGVSSVLISQF